MTRGQSEVTAAGPASGDEGVPPRYLLPYLFHRVANGFEQRWRAELQGRGPTLHRWQVLSILSNTDGLRIGQLAEIACVAQPVLSRVVDQMERDRLVERRPAADDLRGVEVWTTENGRDEFAALVPRAASLVDRALDGLDDDEVALLHSLVSRVLVGLDADGGSA